MDSPKKIFWLLREQEAVFKFCFPLRRTRSIPMKKLTVHKNRRKMDGESKVLLTIQSPVLIISPPHLLCIMMVV